MDIFELRNNLIKDYSSYIKSFINIKDNRISSYTEERINDGLLWSEPLIQLNPSFEPGEWIDDLVKKDVLHSECSNIFKIKPDNDISKPLRLHKHQADAVKIAQTGNNYVLTTGTGSGKSLSYIIPIVNHVLRNGTGKGIQAIVIYPMNALANSQFGELQKFICKGYPDNKGPVTFSLYTGQESDKQKAEIIANPPDILLTNYVMLELILTRPQEKNLIRAAQGLKFLALDELHTYRGRQGSDVAMLIRRVRERLNDKDLQCVGTSATLAGPGTYLEQQKEVAKIATTLFGAEVKAENVIGETLKRSTPNTDLNNKDFISLLTKRAKDENIKPSEKYHEFVNDPLSIWIESTFGVKEDNGRIVRCKPISIRGKNGAGKRLSEITGLEESKCESLIQETLMAGYNCEHELGSAYSPFAFRLHQFISRGDTVYASLENEETRYISVQGQRFVPGDRDKILLPLTFCRECGQEYYAVKMSIEPKTGKKCFSPRMLSEQSSYNNEISGLLYLNSENPWPDDWDLVVDKIPEDWVEEYKGRIRLKSNRKNDIPHPYRLNTSGIESDNGDIFHFIEGNFKFCLNCGVTYGSRQKSDFGKLSSLSAGGRSTATTILSLSAIKELKNSDLNHKAKKLLSFTDNRQDASLQSGHFNDFIEVGLLRSALYLAVSKAGEEGINHDELTQKVFNTLNLPFESYANDPNVMFNAKKEKERALRDVLGYRLYRDLERGWRITSPNLEQCGLLEIKYHSLEEACSHNSIWQNSHPALSGTSPENKIKVSKALLDFMRRELAIKVDYLDQEVQERIKQRSNQHLIQPWSIDENETMEYSSILFPRSKNAGKNDYGGYVYLSSRSAFGQYIRRTLSNTGFGKLKLEDTEIIIRDLLNILSIAGLVEVVIPEKNNEVAGYQLPASAMYWVVGDAVKPFHDPLRTLRESNASNIRVNNFFVDLYKNAANSLIGLEAREHTAQVSYEERIDRENNFREARLPILYCSPTMELGVDISDLNVVNMRNVPPTPANYAQRSGRAGRSGQPALVFTYCSIGNSHDQYFFKRPHLMVSGSVSTPRLDIANEELIQAHIQAIWLAETKLSLGTSLKDILDLTGEYPSMKLLERVEDAIKDPDAKERAIRRGKGVLEAILETLLASDWYYEGWLEDTISKISREFDLKCNRWRELYNSALNQARTQSAIILDASRSADDKSKAQKLRKEAESQINLLASSDNISQSDFYSYRYFASEGFLPGYSFPRLPISAYIPGKRRRGQERDEFLTRPRFLAISEFGPRSIVYHEGSKYIINKVILPVTDDENILTTSAKQCDNCGYIHLLDNDKKYDLCERCNFELGLPLTSLFRLQNVATKRRDRINSDEEERTRMGYEIKSGIRFFEVDGKPVCHKAKVISNENEIADITYANTATLWRINLGWAKRTNRNELGFVLDKERGYWGNNKQLADDSEDNLSPNTIRVIPYVEDRRNCMLINFSSKIDLSVLASFQAAMKNAIQIQYQLEDSELAAEPLPDNENRKTILFYESAEGGAGVLRRLIDDKNALARVAKKALELCHYNSETGEDLKHAPGSMEDCEAACYDCLMSYSNQKEHSILDRKLIKDLLMEISKSTVDVSPTNLNRNEHFDQLINLSGSGLERKWLSYLDDNGYHLPVKAQELIEKCNTRPDFSYDKLLVYIDGPVHDYSDRKVVDKRQLECLEDYGYTVVRFTDDENKWEEIIKKYPNTFGKGNKKDQVTKTRSLNEELDLDLYDERLHELLIQLQNTGKVVLTPGGDISSNGKVVGNFLAEISSDNKVLRLIDTNNDNLVEIEKLCNSDGKKAIQLSFNEINSINNQILSELGV